jgi:hypothetical protein
VIKAEASRLLIFASAKATLGNHQPGQKSWSLLKAAKGPVAKKM